MQKVDLRNNSGSNSEEDVKKLSDKTFYDLQDEIIKYCVDILISNSRILVSYILMSIIVLHF